MDHIINQIQDSCKSIKLEHEKQIKKLHKEIDCLKKELKEQSDRGNRYQILFYEERNENLNLKLKKYLK